MALACNEDAIYSAFPWLNCLSEKELNILEIVARNAKVGRANAFTNLPNGSKYVGRQRIAEVAIALGASAAGLATTLAGFRASADYAVAIHQGEPAITRYLILTKCADFAL